MEGSLDSYVREEDALQHEHLVNTELVKAVAKSFAPYAWRPSLPALFTAIMRSSIVAMLGLKETCAIPAA